MEKKKRLLVGVEEPWVGGAKEPELVIVVTDDVEGFGPCLLARIGEKEVPLERTAIQEPLQAALAYMARYGLEGQIARISCNMTERFDEWEYRKGKWIPVEF